MSAALPIARPPGFTSVAGVIARQRPLAAVSALVLTGAATALALVQPLVLRDLVTALGAGTPARRLVGALLILMIGEAVVRGLVTWGVQVVSEDVTRGLRTGLADHVLRLPLRTLEQTRRGDLVSRLTADSTLVRQVLSAGVLEVASSALLIVGSLVMMSRLDLVLTLIAVGAIVGAVLVVLPVAGRLRRLHAGYQERVGGLGVLFDSLLSSVRLLRVYAAEPEYLGRVRAGADLARADGRHLARVSAVVEPVVAVVAQGAFLAVLIVGGARVNAGHLQVGDLVGFLLYLFMVLLPTAQLLNGLAKTQAGVAAWGRVHEVLGLAQERRGGTAGVTAPDLGVPVLELDGASFEYRPGVGLREVCVAFPPRSHTAVVGPSGAGKSTLVALLARFYDPDAGSLRFHGAPAAGVDLTAYRQRVHLVEQNAPALGTTIRDNLLVAGVGADDETLTRALEGAGLEGLVRRGGPDLLDADIGDGGLRLSGGERQRLAWARLLLSEREVVLLDEPTSNVDPETENAFTEIVAELATRCTVITVAHRLSTVRGADQVVVVDRGRIVAVGSNEDLLRDCPLFARLAEA